MSTSESDVPSSKTGSRSWLEDDRTTTVEAETAAWEEVKKGSDELLAHYWTNYGKWGM
jgi:hypothetical protein